MSQSLINALTAQRNAHLDNIDALESRAPKLDPDAAARAARTIDNLCTQARELKTAIAKLQGRAAA